MALLHYLVSFLFPSNLHHFLHEICIHGVGKLSGGYGTMEEVLEMITWSQLGIHKKPVSCPF